MDSADTAMTLSGRRQHRLSDEPIRLLSDQAVAELGNARTDALGFAAYARAIARVIAGTRVPLTIGIFGEWGTGKTSLMRMIERDVREASHADTIIVPVWFNAWMFEHSEYPVVPLIKSIIRTLKEKEGIAAQHGSSLKHVVDTLEALANAITIKGTLSLPGRIANLEAEFRYNEFQAGRAQRRERNAFGIHYPDDPYEAIFKAFDKIADHAVPHNITILVLIDDLDRCFPENAVRLLEGIKLVLSQPGFIYVLGASRVVIEEYLQFKYEKEYGIKNFDGKAYLDKIIQLSFDIPPHKVRIDEFTRQAIEELTEEETKEELRSISDIISRACQSNPRRIVRFINRLLTDVAIYKNNTRDDAESEVPIGVFAVTRALQQSWKNLYTLLISGDFAEDREYCTAVGNWSAVDLIHWKGYGTGDSQLDSELTKSVRKLRAVDHEVLKDIATQILSDRTLKALIEGQTGRQWLSDHRLREASISFLVSLTSSQQATLASRGGADWREPSLTLLADRKQPSVDAGDVKANAQTIQETLTAFGIDVELEGARVGPRVTQYIVRPPADVPLAKVTALENNLMLNLAAHTVRIEAPIPGKRAVGIEVPNTKTAVVQLRDILTSKAWQRAASPLTLAVGSDVGGEAVVVELDKLPHLLIAGAVGSGRSAIIHTLLVSLLYRNSPHELKLILVDPTQVNLGVYSGIPHLLTPVITQPEICLSALQWALDETERRYVLLAEERVRNIKGYNSLKKDSGDEMPYVLIVINELADLMAVAAQQAEMSIVRLTQLARAVGIHLILATRQPDSGTITGLIRANVSARIALKLATQIDSRTVIDQIGAEKLLGQGDLLFLTSELGKPRRVQGAFISNSEVVAVTDYLRTQLTPDSDDQITLQPVRLDNRGPLAGGHTEGDSNDDLYTDAVRAVIESRKASTSLLQRRLRIGYGRSARLIETMEAQGIISSADGVRPRDVLVDTLEAAEQRMREANLL